MLRRSSHRKVDTPSDEDICTLLCHIFISHQFNEENTMPIALGVSSPPLVDSSEVSSIEADSQAANMRLTSLF